MNQSESPQIKALKELYKSSLNKKIDLLERHRSDLRDDSGHRLSEVYEDLHKLAGSSGMYGYDEISSCCRDTMTRQNNTDMIEGLESLINLLKHYR